MRVDEIVDQFDSVIQRRKKHPWDWDDLYLINGYIVSARDLIRSKANELEARLNRIDLSLDDLPRYSTMKGYETKVEELERRYRRGERFFIDDLPPFEEMDDILNRLEKERENGNDGRRSTAEV